MAGQTLSAPDPSFVPVIPSPTGDRSGVRPRAVYCAGSGNHFYLAYQEEANVFQFGPRSANNLVSGGKLRMGFLVEGTGNVDPPRNDNRGDGLKQWYGNTPIFEQTSTSRSVYSFIRLDEADYWEGERFLGAEVPAERRPPGADLGGALDPFVPLGVR